MLRLSTQRSWSVIAHDPWPVLLVVGSLRSGIFSVPLAMNFSNCSSGGVRVFYRFLRVEILEME
jgi:hypothetical protein